MSQVLPLPMRPYRLSEEGYDALLDTSKTLDLLVQLTDEYNEGAGGLPAGLVAGLLSSIKHRLDLAVTEVK